MDKTKRALPKPTPETAHFWEGTKSKQLLLQSCASCYHIYFPPRPFCPACGSKDVKIQIASGKATLDSYVINHRKHPAFDSPYSIAIVKLEEGPQMMTNIVDCPQTPEALQLDMPLAVKYEELSDEITLPLFAPVRVSDE